MTISAPARTRASKVATLVAVASASEIRITCLFIRLLYTRLRLGDPEPYRGTVAASSGQGGYLLSARLLRGDSAHAVARHQGRQAASAGGRSLIVVGCLGALKSLPHPPAEKKKASAGQRGCGSGPK